MRTKRIYLLTAVCLLFLIYLTACSGGAEDEAETAAEETTAEEALEEDVEIAEEEAAEAADEDVEATGSESDGKDILPTPVTGAKVSATRVGGRVAMDLFFLVHPATRESLNLSAVPDWLAAPSASLDPQFGFSYFNDAAAVAAEFNPDFEAVTAFLAQPPNDPLLSLTPAELLDQLEQLPGWRIEADRLVFLFIPADFGTLDDTDLAAIIDTAVAHSTAIYPFLIGDASLETQQMWQQLAAETNGRLAQIAEPAPANESWAQELGQSLDHALEN